MNTIEVVEQQVVNAEKTYFTELDLAAEILGKPHPRDPRHIEVKKTTDEKTTI
jgi:hypothetical protein